jgi:hypothetical protein
MNPPTFLCITPATGQVRRYVGKKRAGQVSVEPNSPGDTPAQVLPQLLDQLEVFRKWGANVLEPQTS